MIKRRKLPVTVLSGFIEPDKPTLLNHVLINRHGLKVALLVKHMSEVNIDEKIVAKSTSPSDRR